MLKFMIKFILKGNIWYDNLPDIWRFLLFITIMIPLIIMVSTIDINNLFWYYIGMSGMLSILIFRLIPRFIYNK